MKFLILTLIICSNVSARPEIVGGREAKSSEAPWVIKINRSGADHCSGSLIGRKWVLTAGHCFDQGTWSDSYSVLGGGSGSRSDLVDLGPIKEIYVHPDYVTISLTPRADIALVELEKEVKISKVLSPIPLVSKDEFSRVRDLQEVTIFGWGKIGANEEKPAALMRMDQSLVKTDKILELTKNPFFKKYPRWVSEDFAVIVSDDVRTCYGDSGTGWIMSLKGKPGLVAVHSAGDVCKSISIGNLIWPHLEWFKSIGAL